MAKVVVAGSFIQDLTFGTDSLPSPGETRIATLSTGPGGKGSNQAVACRRQGVDTLFIAAVGDDVFGRGYADFARAEGLETVLEVVPGTPTGAAAILVDARAQNMIAVALGASGELSTDAIEGQRARIERAEVFVAQLEANLSAERRGLEIARSAGVLTILNPAPIHPALPRPLLELADILTPNEAEFSFILERFHGRKLGPRFWETADAELAGLCDLLGAPLVVLTLGAEGCFVSRRSSSRPLRCLDKSARCPYRIPAAPVRPVDSTGAGDALSGALAAALTLYPGDLLSALGYATAAAGLSTERPGAALSMPRGDEVRSFLEAHRLELTGGKLRWT